MQHMPETTETLCPLCGRLLAEPCNRHHLVPLSKGGKGTTTVLMHTICHNKIHAVLTEAELKRFYHTIERLQQQEEIAKFIKWVKNKPPEFYDSRVKKKR
jgi:5-methylcytosine-specific restriction endonuclease McrA